MATRRLILVALVAGLAILLAGGVQLLVFAGDEGSEARAEPALTLGQSASVGGADMSLVDAEAAGGRLVLGVSATAVGGAVADVADGWGVLSGGELVALMAPGSGPSGAPECAGLELAQGESVTCSLTFEEPDEGEPVVIYGRGDDRATWTINGDQ